MPWRKHRGDITVGGLRDRLLEYRAVGWGQLRAQGKEEKAERLAEKVSCILEVCEDLNNDDPIRRVVMTIERLFGEGDSSKNTNVLHLCTIHGCLKGREWKRFIVGRNEYQPSYWAVKSGEIWRPYNRNKIDVRGCDQDEGGIGGGGCASIKRRGAGAGAADEPD